MLEPLVHLLAIDGQHKGPQGVYALLQDVELRGYRGYIRIQRRGIETTQVVLLAELLEGDVVLGASSALVLGNIQADMVPANIDLGPAANETGFVDLRSGMLHCLDATGLRPRLGFRLLPEEELIETHFGDVLACHVIAGAYPST